MLVCSSLSVRDYKYDTSTAASKLQLLPATTVCALEVLIGLFC
jgi:hypothetical protein